MARFFGKWKARRDCERSNGMNERKAETPRAEEEFFPKGAIAFFASMLVGFGLIWLGMYLLMVKREFWL